MLFPPEIVKAAQEADKNTNCPTCVSLAQWALESGYGKFTPAPFNYFGIKWHVGCKYDFHLVPTKEFIEGIWITIPAKFIAFPGVKEAFDYHAELLTKKFGPYVKALPYVRDWKKFVQVIGPIYATDPLYTEKLISLIEDHKLEQYNL